MSQQKSQQLTLGQSALAGFYGSDFQTRRSQNSNEKYRRGIDSAHKKSSAPMSPIANNEKAKRLFPSKEKINQYKGNLASKATQELDFHHSKFEIMKMNILNLTDRERFQHKNLKGLIGYAKKLTQELEDYRIKVKMAEKIIQDLKSTGNESLDSLLHMLNGYQAKYNQVKHEIEKLKQLVMLKDDEILQLDEDIGDLSSFVSTAKAKLEDKIDDLLHTLEENKRMIRRQDKIIVDLQQKNEVSQLNIAETAEEAQRRGKEKNKLQLKLKELEDQKSNIQDSIHNIESKIGTFRTQYGNSQNSSHPYQTNANQESQNYLQQHSIQWKDVPVIKGSTAIVRDNTTSSKQPLQQNTNTQNTGPSPLKSALASKSIKTGQQTNFKWTQKSKQNCRQPFLRQNKYQLEIWIKNSKKSAVGAPVIRKFQNEEIYQKYNVNLSGIPLQIAAI
ncbi:UNKNOWN [Stylonychia lemnae]|uniref:Uncharacterized protein n=1 Tax=Stylonychia lemnae TaxID=5949 RepID=A0A078B0V1_STYLE|nr:UNKNOWN [Stylonychia lemnae]|eukprot:CDW87931.1 UNKNOWN [Stylonychia lemnae]